MHAKHLYVPHLARPLSAKGCTGCMLGARCCMEDCSGGLLERVAQHGSQKDCSEGAQNDAQSGAQMVCSLGLIFRIRGSQVLGAWKVGGLKVGTAVCWWAIFTQHGKDCRLLCGYWCVGMGSRGATQGPGGVARSFVCIAGHMVCAGERRHGLGHRHPRSSLMHIQLRGGLETSFQKK